MRVHSPIGGCERQNPRPTRRFASWFAVTSVVMKSVGRIVSIWRYPVKSMAGERVGTAAVGPLGLHADRTWAVRDRAQDVTTSAKKLPGLLMLTARYAGLSGREEPPRDAGPGRAPEVIIGFPDGTELSSADPAIHTALSSYLDHDVELRPLPPVQDKAAYRGAVATQADLRTIFGLEPDEPLPDLSMFPIRKLAEISRYATPVGTYVDAYPLHLLTLQSLGTMGRLAPDSDFDVRRFRPSILIDAAVDDPHPELDWCGRVLRAPGAGLAPMIPTIRCVMPSHRQPGLSRDPAITRTVAAHAHRCLGVYAMVSAAGRIAEGDELKVDVKQRDSSKVIPGGGGSFKRALLKAVAAALPRR